jgi:hypothetical protein
MRPLIPSTGRWVSDPRGDGRAVRVSAHAEAGFLVLSTWKAERCVATVRLLPDEAASLIAGLSEALASLAVPPAAGSLDGPDVAELAARIGRLEQQVAERPQG